MSTRMRIRHVINTVGSSARNDLLEAQDLTLRSIEAALRLAPRDVEVEVVGVHFADEALPISWLRGDWTLERSVLNRGSFTSKRRLPLLADVLAPFNENDYDLGVFTNIDIALQPAFYELVTDINQSGHDAFTINRRTVYPRYGVNTDAWLASQTGVPHSGHDCFVFTPDVIRRAEVSDVCIGVPLVGRALLFNMMLQADSFRQFIDLNATFHIGDDRPWRRPEMQELVKHNEEAFARLVLKLVDRFGESEVKKLPRGRSHLIRARNPRKRDIRRPRSRNAAQNPPAGSFDRRRLVFAASPGRSGTEYLARLLGTAKRTKSFHEGAPTMAGEPLRAVAYRGLEASYDRRQFKAEALKFQLKNLPSQGVLVETSHMFVKTFADIALDEFNHDRIAIVHLQRPLLPLLASMMGLGWFTGHAPAWRDWLIPPTAPHSRFPITPDRITGPLDAALGYILDSAIRARDLRMATPNVKWVDLTIEQPLEREDAIALFEKLDLDPSDGTLRQAEERVNRRGKNKATRNVGMSQERLETEVRAFAERFASEIHAVRVEDMFSDVLVDV